MTSNVIIYTDGGCNPNPGRGGWAAILLFEHNGITHYKELSGGEAETTNNRMEILAVLNGLEALKLLKRSCVVTIFSDSKYVVNGIGDWDNGKPTENKNGWIVNWKQRSWSKKDGELKNIDLWITIYELIQKQKSVTMKWIRGHTGHEYNERCDILAVEARRSIINDPMGHRLRPTKNIFD